MWIDSTFLTGRSLNIPHINGRFPSVEKGMVADVNIHRDKPHNPHAHIMLTMRPFNEDGTWGEKRPFTGQLDDKGKKFIKIILAITTNPNSNEIDLQCNMFDFSYKIREFLLNMVQGAINYLSKNLIN